ncbi:hypothetical protein RRG08_042613 [Elysia crispata]|uniref:Uncharacterized protein n=1 Tax=Elysia crispata TaxID=231223 RepID=A0AAE1CK32_9GAST|nr:hypothetical protein RRG08_042613 [Elysia crispata]
MDSGGLIGHEGDFVIILYTQSDLKMLAGRSEANTRVTLARLNTVDGSGQSNNLGSLETLYCTHSQHLTPSLVNYGQTKFDIKVFRKPKKSGRDKQAGTVRPEPRIHDSILTWPDSTIQVRWELFT